MTTITTYSPTQIAAAHRLHDTCHNLLAVTADEPAGGADYEQRWQEWHDLYGQAYRVHEDAEAEYRHEFPNPATRPEAHEVIAAARTSIVELLRVHVVNTVTQLPSAGFDNPEAVVTIDCSCGSVINGIMPDHLDSTTGSLQWVMAEHIAREVLAARR